MNCPNILNQKLCINAVHWGGEEFLSGSDKIRIMLKNRDATP